MPGNAPVNRVGGHQDRGPWPTDVDEIAEGESHSRPVRLFDGSEKEVPVTVRDVHPVKNEQGEDTGGTVVSFTYEDPTAGGGN